MKFSILFSLLIIFIASACSTSEPNIDSEKTEVDTKDVQNNEVDQLMIDIDADMANMPLAQSLLYTKEDNTITDATVYFDKNNVVAKIEDYFLDGPTSKITRTSFYFNGGVKFASRKIQQIINKDKKEYFSEKVTFYDKKGKATSTKERITDFEELLENESYHTADIVSMDETESLKKINKEGEFVTTFQGFVDAGPYAFLVVGEDKADGYTSSLSLQTPSSTVNYLKTKGKQELGRPLAVEFERIQDNQGYEMQILMDVKLIEQTK